MVNLFVYIYIKAKRSGNLLSVGVEKSKPV